MESLSALLLEFDKCLGDGTISVARFVEGLGRDVPDEWLLQLIGVYVEHQFRIGKFDCAAQVHSLESEFPQLTRIRIETVISEGLDNFTSSFCPVAHHLGPMPVEHGQFLILNEIGRGGTGVVYQARQLSLDRPVALKVSFSSECDIETEGKILSRLNHRHFASIYDYGTVGHLPFIAMEVVHGESLKNFCRTPPVLPPSKSASLVAKILDAVAECHSRGIVHHDLKPSNIILTDDGPVVVDFGLASLSTMRNVSGTGSPTYMAPELLLASPGIDSPRVRSSGIGSSGIESPRVDLPRVESPILCDIFSIGVILYELLTGSRPYGRNIAALRDPPRRCVDFVPEIDAELDRICQKAIAFSPSERYQTANSFRDALERWLSDQAFESSEPHPQHAATAASQPPPTHRDGLSKKSFNKTTAICLVSFCLGGAAFALPGLFRSDSATSELKVTAYRENVTDSSISPLGDVGDSEFFVRKDDFVTVAVNLRKPAFCYLLAGNPDGSLQFLRESKSKVRQFRFPEEDDLFFQLDDGIGQQAFVLIVTKSPLEQWQNWTVSPPTNIGWEKSSPLTGVWKMDGQEMSRMDSVRRRGNLVPRSNQNPVNRLVDWLEMKTQGSVHVVLFPVQQ